MLNLSRPGAAYELREMHWLLSLVFEEYPSISPYRTPFSVSDSACAALTCARKHVLEINHDSNDGEQMKVPPIFI